MSEYELLLHSQEGDQNAQTQLYDTYYVPLYRYLFVRVRHTESVEDMVQDVFMGLFRNLENVQVDYAGTLRSYLFKSAKNRLIDYFRSAGKQQDVDDETIKVILDQKGGVSHMQQYEIRDVIYHVLHLLPETQRDVLVLRYLNDHSTEDVARMLGQTRDNVRQVQSRALKKLKYYFYKLKIL
ncbi:MAG: RNA polymerase sigma factor (sigma-70 family) [Planctomycetota bacterium]|jgi:RNA polymerase sigma factor (sigma-70 family)